MFGFLITFLYSCWTLILRLLVAILYCFSMASTRLTNAWQEVAQIKKNIEFLAKISKQGINIQMDPEMRELKIDLEKIDKGQSKITELAIIPHNLLYSLTTDKHKTLTNKLAYASDKTFPQESLRNSLIHIDTVLGYSDELEQMVGKLHEAYPNNEIVLITGYSFIRTNSFHETLRDKIKQILERSNNITIIIDGRAAIHPSELTVLSREDVLEALLPLSSLGISGSSKIVALTTIALNDIISGHLLSIDSLSYTMTSFDSFIALPKYSLSPEYEEVIKLSKLNKDKKKEIINKIIKTDIFADIAYNVPRIEYCYFHLDSTNNATSIDYKKFITTMIGDILISQLVPFNNQALLKPSKISTTHSNFASINITKENAKITHDVNALLFRTPGKISQNLILQDHAKLMSIYLSDDSGKVIELLLDMLTSRAERNDASLLTIESMLIKTLNIHQEDINFVDCYRAWITSILSQYNTQIAAINAVTFVFPTLQEIYKSMYQLPCSRDIIPILDQIADDKDNLNYYISGAQLQITTSIHRLLTRTSSNIDLLKQLYLYLGINLKEVKQKFDNGELWNLAIDIATILSHKKCDYVTSILKNHDNIFKHLIKNAMVDDKFEQAMLIFNKAAEQITKFIGFSSPLSWFRKAPKKPNIPITPLTESLSDLLILSMEDLYTRIYLNIKIYDVIQESQYLRLEDSDLLLKAFS